jgi:hypothetical protein
MPRRAAAARGFILTPAAVFEAKAQLAEVGLAWPAEPEWRGHRVDFLGFSPDCLDFHMPFRKRAPSASMVKRHTASWFSGTWHQRVEMMLRFGSRWPKMWTAMAPLIRARSKAATARLPVLRQRLLKAANKVGTPKGLREARAVHKDLQAGLRTACRVLVPVPP